MNKIKVYIYDDNIAIVESLKSKISIYFSEKKYELSVAGGTSFSEYPVKPPEKFNEIVVVFMDIELANGESGLESAAQIADINPYAKIFFITGFADRYFNAVFHFHQRKIPDGCLSKPIQFEDIKNTMDKMLLCIRKEYFVAQTKTGTVKIGYADIMFVESTRNKSNPCITVHTKDGKTGDFNMTMREFESEMPVNFYRCHKGFTVNLDYISRINSKDALHSSAYIDFDGFSVSVGRTYYAGLLKRIKEYRSGLL